MMVDKKTEGQSDQNSVDKATGTDFVGHEWDGIRELDTPMPRWWVWTFYLTIIWGIGYMILYPAWPLLTKGTEGVLGWTSRGEFAQQMQLAEQNRAGLRQQIATTPIEQLPQNKALMQKAVAGGSAAFKVNCVQCHGSGAAGSQSLGYPNLADDDWLWGGDLKSIQYTITHGIREPGDEQTRTSEMPPFAGVFDDAQRNSLVNYVLSFSNRAEPNAVGEEIYATNCASCHGADGKGDKLQGAPNLSDAIWLYGGTRAQIEQQILAPRMGMMPKWGDKLDPVTIKMLSAYVYSLGGGEELVEVAPDPASAPEPAVEVDEQP